MATGVVIEATVLGIEDDLLGHRLIAVIVPAISDCNKNQILELCAERLPKYKLPGEIKLVRALPKSTSGKIDRTKCVELIKPKGHKNSLK